MNMITQFTKGKTWRLNDAAILDAQLVEDDPKIADRLARTRPHNC